MAVTVVAAATRRRGLLAVTEVAAEANSALVVAVGVN